MKQSAIVLDATYEGGGVCCVRTVDHIWRNDRGVMLLHWHTMNTMAAEGKNGYTFHTPNRTCTLKHFARWATKRIGDDGDDTP